MIWYTMLFGQFLCLFENKDTIFQMEGVSDLSYELYYCVYIAMNNILT